MKLLVFLFMIFSVSLWATEETFLWKKDSWQVAARLYELGYLSEISKDIKIWDITRAIKHLQIDTGLDINGELDQATIDILNKVSLTPVIQEKINKFGVTIDDVYILEGFDKNLLPKNKYQNSIIWSQYILYLLELYIGPIDGLWNKELKEAIVKFQYSNSIHISGQIDNETFEKLIGYIDIESIVYEKETYVFEPPVIEEISEPEIVLASYSPKENDAVYTIEKIQCKNKNEAWVLFYQGIIYKITKENILVTLEKRYGFWYDKRKQGVSTKDWWCIPRKRFCYSEVKFDQWNGKYKPNETFVASKKSSFAIADDSPIPFIYTEIQAKCFTTK